MCYQLITVYQVACRGVAGGGGGGGGGLVVTFTFTFLPAPLYSVPYEYLDKIDIIRNL